MRFFSSEIGQNYRSYTFAYANYAELESGDSFADLYTRGYLPYSGTPEYTKVFYLARSARIDLRLFELSSENRRIAKKFDGLFSKERVPFKAFTVTPEFLDFCLSYFAQKHGTDTMPKERLEYILSMGLITHVVVYTKGNVPVAYMLAVAEGGFEHYWFSFYDLTLKEQSLGLWLMLDCIRDAKVRSDKYYYLGTVYGSKALYKTNFEPLEWYTGERWSADLKLLKERSRTDETRAIALMDAWKGTTTSFTV